jgi:CPA1 family monovalent cation:H+ antiporter
MPSFGLEGTAIIFLSIASLVAVASRHIKLPYTIALVIAGILVSLTELPSALSPGLRLTPELIFLIFLPALLFEASFHLEFAALRQNIRPITFLAIIGVGFSMLIIGFILAEVFHVVGWPVALLFGALISATDPISVMAIFKELGVAKRLSTIVEGESLFNDGTAIVLFRVMLGVILAGDFNLIHGVGQFAKVALGGVLLGLLIGYFFSQILRPIDDYLVEITFTMVMAYGTFLLAELLHISGVLAVVVGGLVMGNYGARKGMSPTTRMALVSFWEYVAFVANSFIFLLVGLQSDLISSVLKNLPCILAAVLAVLTARAVVLYVLAPSIMMLISRYLRVLTPLPPLWRHVLFWGGLRGSISLALVLSIPESLPERDILLAMASGVVLFSLLVQGLTMKSLLEWLGLVLRSEERFHFAQVRGELLALRAAWQSLRDMHEDGVLSPAVWQTLNQEYRLAGQRLAAEMETLYGEHSDLQREELNATRLDCLRVERSALLDLRRKGILPEEVYSQLVKEVDRRIDQLELHLESGPAETAFTVPEKASGDVRP